MSKKPRLNEDEAKEYSLSLSKAAAGDYELMDFAINTLDVPGALGMEATEWVDSIGGYIRMSVEDRRAAVNELVAEGKTHAQVATILGIGRTTVLADRNYTKALQDLGAEASQGEIGPGDSGAEAKEWTKGEIRDLIDEGKSDAQIAVITGLSPNTIQKHYRKPYTIELEEKHGGKKPNGDTKPSSIPTRKDSSKTSEAEALARLDGILATIEGHALGLAAWWRQEGKEALAGQLAWADETISHTEEKVSMILRSVRGTDADADAALAEWLAEAEG